MGRASKAPVRPSLRGEVLVAIVNTPDDLAIARDQHWYRIPVYSVERFLKGRWPPEWLAFYQPKAFGGDAYRVRYIARVLEVRKALRWELFPSEPINDQTNKRYYQLILAPLMELAEPIPSLRFRRIVFIPTTWTKLVTAEEINDLYDESPLEDELWAELKRQGIVAQRQYFVPVQRRFYALDFAIFCRAGKLDVETDGDSWHADPERIPLDNRRNNDLTGLGWSILRFNGLQIREQVADYCVPEIMRSINRLDGLTANGLVPRPFDPQRPEGPQQLTFPEPRPDDDTE